MAKQIKSHIESENALFDSVVNLIEYSRSYVAKAVNSSMVYTYYGIGQHIVDYEQNGKERAEYGKEILKRLSARLTDVYGPILFHLSI